MRQLGGYGAGGNSKCHKSAKIVILNLIQDLSNRACQHDAVRK